MIFAKLTAMRFNVAISLLAFGLMWRNVSSYKEEILLIEKYMQHKHLKRCMLLNCWPNQAVVSIMKEFEMICRFWNMERNSNISYRETQTFKMLYVLIDNCNNGFSALKNASERNMLNYKHSWLVLLYSSEDRLKSELENITLRFDSDVKIAMLSMDPYIKILDIYNTGFKKNGTLHLDYYGFWNKSTNELLVDDKMKRYHQKSILTDVVLRTSTVVTNPGVKSNFNHYLLDRKPEDLISKFSYSLFVNFQHMHNFTHIQMVQDKWFGNDVGGYEDGVAKYLHEEITDLASVVGLIKASRVEFFDFINPMYRFSTNFMFRNQGTHDLWENEFLKPFTTAVWLSIVMVLVMLTFFLKFTNWIEQILMNSQGSYSFVTAILITISVICQQGSYIIPTRTSSRLLFFIILILSFLLYNYYTSSIVSALLNAKPKELTTYKDLLKSGLELGIQMAPYTITIFKTNMDPDIQAIRRLVFPDGKKPHIWNITDGLEKIRTGHYAYHVESSRAYILIAKSFDARAICELSDKIALIPASYLSFYTKKDSQYKNLMKISLRKMEEVGIVTRNRFIWEKKKPPCLSNAILLSVGLDQTFIAFFILLIGFTAAIILIFIERCINHRRKLSKNQLDQDPLY